MKTYLAYGLGIRSALPLPELVPHGATTDVVIRLGKVPGVPAAARRQRSYARANATVAHLSWPDVGVFRIRHGCEILVEPAPEVEERVLRLFLLGPALAMLLSQRGLLVLHASAVALEGGAVAFLGESGRGKSTTAAAFYARGYDVVADDVVAVLMERGCPVVFPGFPQLKLWPEVVASLGDAVETLARLHPHREKRARRVADQFSSQRLPLKALYVLSEGPGLEIEHLRAREAIIELVRHSYAAQMIRSLGAGPHLVQCAGVAGAAPIRRLWRPPSLQQLPALVRSVTEDLACDPPSLEPLDGSSVPEPGCSSRAAPPHRC
jgi:hypothetical protein